MANPWPMGQRRGMGGARCDGATRSTFVSAAFPLASNESAAAGGSPFGPGRAFLLRSFRYGFGRPTDAYCTILPESAPIEDQMLAQKLMLETNEPGFLELAGSMWPQG